MEPHYLVNGGTEKTVSLLGTKGVKTATGKSMILALEIMKPIGRDADQAVSMTACWMPAPLRGPISCSSRPSPTNGITRSPSRLSGGGYRGGEGSRTTTSAISQRQKEIIAATWNEIRGGAKDKVNSAENAKFLADVQSKLKEQQAISPGAAAAAQPGTGGRQSRVPGVREGYGRSLGSDGAGFRQIEGTIVEGRARAGAEGSATSVARRSDIPRYPGRLRQPGWRGRRWRQRRARSGQPVRPGAGYGKESVRDRTAGAGRVPGAAAKGRGRGAAEAGAARAAPAGTGAAAE